jgi:preprotein translocase subunit SecA
MLKKIKKLIGTSNDREVKKYLKKIKEINKLEKEISKKTDEVIKERFLKLQKQILNNEKTLDEILPEVFAMIREASKRILNMRHFDVQLIGGMVIHDGKIAEMKTGEGKTLVATLPILLNAMNKKGVHVVTVNDYLAKRDAEEMKPLFEFFGMSIGVILEEGSDLEDKSEIYKKDIVYGTNNEFGFDFLRDNMAYYKDEILQNHHEFVIIDEIDSILIDEARTPLIISGKADMQVQEYKKADEIAKQMKENIDFTLDEKDKVVLITEQGIEKAEKLFEVENLYSKENISLSHILNQALKANYLFKKDFDYIIKNDEIVIVDEHTGRLSEGRRYSEGLHQALEAKENVEIKEETQTLASITFQNYFRMYNKIGGMTGTAATEATEFAQIYNLDVVSIPTNKEIKRMDLNDLIYKTEKEKFEAVILKIKELSEKGQPILIGTASIDKSEVLSKLLEKENIQHTVLNAKNHEKEGEIIKNAGKKGSVTIATNMAGRGVDIKITEEVEKLGGLYIIGTERHENRRIDNQLRGRSGRQGDKGTSQFYLSLEDDLLRIFGSEKLKTIMERLGVKEGEYIESKMVSRTIEKAQSKVENMHFEGRKNIVEYDDVINEQRKIVYKFRNQLLQEDENLNLMEKIKENRKEHIKYILNKANIFEGMEIEKEHIESLEEILEEEVRFKIDFKTDEENLEALTYDKIFNTIYNIMELMYETKMNVLQEEIREQIERELYLGELDKLWKNHLHNIDDMKEGIRLRAYNQKDPLTEYKKESYNMFKEFTEELKINISRTLQQIEFEFEE